MNYVVTFYSHFGAVRFKRQCDSAQIPAKTMPVPRNLSSSCGTCVRCDSLPEQEFSKDEIEQIVRAKEDGYEVLYHADED